jgi:hypothetical protein
MGGQELDAADGGPSDLSIERPGSTKNGKRQGVYPGLQTPAGLSHRPSFNFEGQREQSVEINRDDGNDDNLVGHPSLKHPAYLMKFLQKCKSNPNCPAYLVMAVKRSPICFRSSSSLRAALMWSTDYMIGQITYHKISLWKKHFTKFEFEVNLFDDQP